MDYSGFFDLNITGQNSELNQICREWYKYNYRTIAVNQFLDLSQVNDVKKKKGEKEEFRLPEPFSINLPNDLIGKIKVLNRLTIKIPDVSWFPKIFQGKSQHVKSFEIIAVLPVDQACLQQTIACPDVDIICMDHESKPQWKLTRKLYNVGVEQNKYFEIIYSPLIIDSTARKNIIQMSHQYFTVAKSRNIIVSSGTSKTVYLRSPYEVLHVCFLFGLNENEARNTITQNPKNLLNRTLKRKLGKSIFSITTGDIQ